MSTNKGCYAAVFPSSSFRKYAEGVDIKLKQPLQNATLTGGLNRNSTASGSSSGSEGDKNGKEKRAFNDN